MIDNLSDLDFRSKVERVVAEVTEGKLGQEASDPGLIAGLYLDGELVDWYTFGLASIEHLVPIAVDTAFDIASCSKQFTAATTLRVADQGLLDLDVDLREFVPELGLSGITMRSCLTHTAGLNDYMTLTELAGQGLGNMVDSRDFLACVRRMSTTTFEPGSDIRYSNSGYVLAAIAIARVCGKTFTEVLTEQVLKPLGMTNTRVHDRVGKVIPAAAMSYSREGERWAREEMVESQVGDGAIVTTIGDLARWQGFLLDGRVLGADVRDRLLTRASLTSGRECPYALGIHHLDLGVTSGYGHGGAMYGYRSNVVCVPTLGVGFAILSNCGDMPVYSIMRSLSRTVIDGLGDVPVSTRTPATAASASTTQPAAPTGTWLAPEASNLLTLESTGDAVRLRQLDRDLLPTGDVWRDAMDEYTLAVEGEELVLTDDMGHRSVWSIPEQTDISPVDLVGDYFSADLDRQVAITVEEDASVILRVSGGFESVVSDGFARDDQICFPLVAGGAVTLHASPKATVVLSIWGALIPLQLVGES